MSEEAEINDDNEWIEVELPSEGEKESSANAPASVTPEESVSPSAPNAPEPLAAPEASTSTHAPAVKPTRQRQPKPPIPPSSPISTRTRRGLKAAAQAQGEQASVLLHLSDRTSSMPASRTINKAHSAALANASIYPICCHANQCPSAASIVAASGLKLRNFQSVNWVRVIADTIDIDAIVFRDPESHAAYYYDQSSIGLTWDNGRYPNDVYDDLKHVDKN
ncbi:hypothetical protein BDV93DRAFT_514190 [Ceratobasidium sp. AG-I]|nr:hypothetical protein BDV93DRAFT_514190 [Ceratobasidium sp. AG-I]